MGEMADYYREQEMYDDFAAAFPRIRKWYPDEAPEGMWEKKDTSTMPIADMDAQHIQNSIAMLDRKGHQLSKKRLELVKEQVRRRELAISLKESPSK